MNHDEGWKVFRVFWLVNLAVHYKDNVYRLRSRINSEEKSSSWEDNSCPVRESHVSFYCHVLHLSAHYLWWRSWAQSAVRASWQSASEFLYNRACNTHYSKLTKDSKNKRKTFSNVIFTWERFSKYEKPKQRFWEIFTRTLWNTQICSPNLSTLSIETG